MLEEVLKTVRKTDARQAATEKAMASLLTARRDASRGGKKKEAQRDLDEFVKAIGQLP
jgi:hypothetical protein